MPNKKDKLTDRRKSILSKISLYSAIFGWLLPIASIVIAEIFGITHEYEPSSGERFITSLMLISPFLFLISLVSGILALIQIKLRKGIIGGKSFAFYGIVLSLIPFILALSLIYIQYLKGELSKRWSVLDSLGKALSEYSQAYDGQFPDPNKWCDLLEPYIVDSNNVFIINSKGQKVCYCAMNPNAKPDSPPKTVIFFESKAGWNQVGGKELINTERYINESDYFVLLNTKRYVYESDYFLWRNKEDEGFIVGHCSSRKNIDEFNWGN